MFVEPIGGQCDQTTGTHAADAKTFAILTAWDLRTVEDYVRREDLGVRDAGKAVAEYRKFIFMAISAQHPCVPSRDIDEVWHAHMLHSRDYLAFCKAVGRDYIHHEPSLPGERPALEPFFDKTAALYEEIFGAAPEPAVWGARGMAICDFSPGHDCRGTCSHNCQNN